MNQNKQPTVLIVDDEMSDIIIMQEMLSDLDVHCMAVTSANEALALVGQVQGISLVLLDIHMPEMTGFELALKLRAMPAYRETPIIFVSASNNDQAEIAAYEYGAIDYICKPASPYVLRAKVALHIKLYHAYLAFAKASEQLNQLKSMLQKSDDTLVIAGSGEAHSHEALLNQIRSDHQLMWGQLKKIVTLHQSSLADIGYYPSPEEQLTSVKEKAYARSC